MGKKKAKPHYSGAASREFWDRIHALPSADHKAMYRCACLLQDMESTVLVWLEHAEIQAVKPSPQPKKKGKR